MELFLASVEARAFRMARFACSRDDLALDLVQDAMLKFVRKYAKKPEDQWRPLFYKVLQNRIKDWYRSTTIRARFRALPGGRDREDAGPDPVGELPDVGVRDPVEELAAADSLQALEQALGELAEGQRSAFLLRAWEGLSVAETALAMGCSQGTVKTQYSRAVHALRNKLEEYRP